MDDEIPIVVPSTTDRQHELDNMTSLSGETLDDIAVDANVTHDVETVPVGEGDGRTSLALVSVFDDVPHPCQPPPYESYTYFPSDDLQLVEETPTLNYIHRQSFLLFVGTVCLAFVAFCFFGFLIGAAACIVAVIGRKEAFRGNFAKAHQLYHISWGLSIAAISIGIIFYGVLRIHI